MIPNTAWSMLVRNTKKEKKNRGKRKVRKKAHREIHPGLWFQEITGFPPTVEKGKNPMA